MYLRKLKIEDAPLMLEWMHDANVVNNMGTNFAQKTIEDCIRFIESSTNSELDMNLAIVSDDDTYMGTVSLKHINKELGLAEFAITVRTGAMGKGFSSFAMSEILKIGFGKLGLSKIIWCVSVKNLRAIRFYDKNGYQRVIDVPKEIEKNYKDASNSLIWYSVSNNNII